MRVEMPLKTVSLLNMREHFRVAAKRKAMHRNVTATLLRAEGEPPAMPVVVTLTRISPGSLDEHDNLPSAFKHIVDEIAAWLKVDDADKRVTWRYAQEKCKRGQFGVRLEIA